MRLSIVVLCKEPTSEVGVSNDEADELARGECQGDGEVEFKEVHDVTLVGWS